MFIYSLIPQVNGVSIVKSGSQFKEFSKININFKESPVAVEVECITVEQEDTEEHAEMKQISEEFNGNQLRILEMRNHNLLFPIRFQRKRRRGFSQGWCRSRWKVLDGSHLGDQSGKSHC